MFPEPLTLGPLHFSVYGLMAAAGVLAALALFSRTARHRGLTPGQARDFCFWMVLIGIFGARIFYVMFHWPEFADQMTEVFAYWRGGLMFQGGVILAALASPFILKRYRLDFWSAMDVMAPSLALGQSLGRLGCFGAGCCYGRPAGPGNPLAVIFPLHSQAPSGWPLWPAQLMDALCLAVLSVILCRAIRSASFRRPGQVTGLYLLLAGLTRVGMDFMRGDYRGDPIIGNLPPTTLAAMAAAGLGLAALWLRRPARTF